MTLNSARLSKAPDASVTADGTFVSIRGCRLDLRELVDPRIADPEFLSAQRRLLSESIPFPHLVTDRLFDSRLLELVWEEFDIAGDEALQAVATRHELTHRSPVGLRLPPACQLYFGIVNSGWFVEAMSTVAGVDDLITDARLVGGGLHETRSGGSFDVHRDFDLHVRTGLRNELALITYLNRDWDPAWGGALELWDGDKARCVTRIQPEMGRSVLLRHTASSYHGHPGEMNLPAGQRRRSVANYYYSNPSAELLRSRRSGTEYLAPHPIDQLKRFTQMLTPPVVWDFFRQRRRL